MYVILTHIAAEHRASSAALLEVSRRVYLLGTDRPVEHFNGVLEREPEALRTAREISTLQEWDAWVSVYRLDSASQNLRRGVQGCATCLVRSFFMGQAVQLSTLNNGMSYLQALEGDIPATQVAVMRENLARVWDRLYPGLHISPTSPQLAGHLRQQFPELAPALNDEPLLRRSTQDQELCANLARLGYSCNTVDTFTAAVREYGHEKGVRIPYADFIRKVRWLVQNRPALNSEERAELDQLRAEAGRRQQDRQAALAAEAPAKRDAPRRRQRLEREDEKERRQRLEREDEKDRRQRLEREDEKDRRQRLEREEAKQKRRRAEDTQQQAAAALEEAQRERERLASRQQQAAAALEEAQRERERLERREAAAIAASKERREASAERRALTAERREVQQQPRIERDPPSVKHVPRHGDRVPRKADREFAAEDLGDLAEERRDRIDDLQRQKDLLDRRLAEEEAVATAPESEHSATANQRWG